MFFQDPQSGSKVPHACVWVDVHWILKTFIPDEEETAQQNACDTAPWPSEFMDRRRHCAGADHRKVVQPVRRATHKFLSRRKCHSHRSNSILCCAQLRDNLNEEMS